MVLVDPSGGPKTVGTLPPRLYPGSIYTVNQGKPCAKPRSLSSEFRLLENSNLPRGEASYIIPRPREVLTPGVIHQEASCFADDKFRGPLPGRLPGVQEVGIRSGTGSLNPCIFSGVLFSLGVSNEVVRNQCTREHRGSDWSRAIVRVSTPKKGLETARNVPRD